MRNKSERGSSYMSFLRRRLLQINRRIPEKGCEGVPAEPLAVLGEACPELVEWTPSGNKPENSNSMASGNL